MFGLVMVLVGVLFLLDNLGWFGIGRIWRDYWPVILMVIGGGRLVDSERPHGRVWGGFLFLLGSVFLLSNLGILARDVWRYIWPFALIFWGISMLFGRRYWRNRWQDRDGGPPWGPGGPGGGGPGAGGPSAGPGNRGFGPGGFGPGGFSGGPGFPGGGAPASGFTGPSASSQPRDQSAGDMSAATTPGGNPSPGATGFSGAAYSGPSAGGFRSNPAHRLREVAILGGVKRRIDSQEFEGGEVTAFMGGVELDLSGAGTKLDELVIEANSLMGGIELRVPQGWSVTVQGTGILGGYEDATRESVQPSNFRRPHLLVTGTALMGGVSVRN
jgi:hypothetical protein